MTRPDLIRYRYFFLSFAAAFFVLSLLFLFLMTIVQPRTPKALLSGNPQPVSEPYQPDPADTLTVLFLGVATEDAVAGSYILARFDPARDRVPVIVLPPQTLLQVEGRQETLEEAYRFGGARYTSDKLAQHLGISIDRYVRVGLESFVAAASAVGSVEYDLPRDIEIGDGSGGFTLNRGPQLLDGRRVAELICRPDLPENETERCELAALIVCAVVNQRIDVAASELVDKVFERVINLISTDISYADYERRKQSARYLADLGEDVAFAVPLSGSTREEDTAYVLQDTCEARILQYFS